MTGAIAPSALRDMLRRDGELAVLDVREEGVFARGHLLLASSLPLSRLELHVLDLVPRRGTPIVLCDDDDGLAARAAKRLHAFGYTDLGILEGGVAAWRRAGYVLFTGVNVPSKAFGEFIEATEQTPHISAAELKAKLDAGEDIAVLDSRPLDEYRVMNIPGAVDCPGAELVYRSHDLAPSPRTLVVVNCAGRTRSIIGTQSLINAGVPNPVMALKDGTMGWHLAGFELERGMQRRPPEVSPAGLERAKAAAKRVAARFGVRAIDRALLDRWRAESGARSLYLFDVRGPEEYEAGHLAGSLPAPGGQLVQKTDACAATRGARVVLVDDDGVRARMTASWLVQMGLHEVAVLEDGICGQDALVSGPHRPEIPGQDAVDEIVPAELSARLARGEALVIDLATSLQYRAQHIPGAWFAIRSRLASSLPRLPSAEMLVLTSPDGVLARLAAPEVDALARVPVRVLQGGSLAWREAGLPVASGLENLADECDDVFWRPYDRDRGAENAMNDYLAWEMGLLEQVELDGTLRFGLASGRRA